MIIKLQFHMNLYMLRKVCDTVSVCVYVSMKINLLPLHGETSTRCMLSLINTLLFIGNRDNNTNSSIHMSQDGRVCTICH